MPAAVSNPLAPLAAPPAAKAPDPLRSEAAGKDAGALSPQEFARELQRRIAHEHQHDKAADESPQTPADAPPPLDPAAVATLPAGPEAALMAALLQASGTSQAGAGSLPDEDAATRALQEAAADPAPDGAADPALAALAALGAALMPAALARPAAGSPLAAEPARAAANIAAAPTDAAGTARGESPAADATASFGLLDPHQGPFLQPAENAAARPLEAADALTAKLAGQPPEAPLQASAEPAPSNSFASIHAAALANLRGESPAPAASPVPLHVATPAGSPGWPEEVGTRVRWMVGAEESHAQLSLSPPQLGKIEVSISISGGETSAQFVAATPAARELIEQSLPRLREVLEQSGITLGQTDVGTSGQSGSSGEGRQSGAWNGRRGSEERLAEGTPASPWLRRGEGLVDTFA